MAKKFALLFQLSLWIRRPDLYPDSFLSFCNLDSSYEKQFFGILHLQSEYSFRFVTRSCKFNIVTKYLLRIPNDIDFHFSLKNIQIWFFFFILELDLFLSEDWRSSTQLFNIHKEFLIRISNLRPFTHRILLLSLNQKLVIFSANFETRLSL